MFLRGHGVRTRCLTAAGLSLLLTFEVLAASVVQLVAPAPACAFVAETVAVQAALDQAIATYGGSSALASQWSSSNVSRRSAEGIQALLARAGADVKGMAAVGTLAGAMYVTYLGMKAKNYWTAFSGACESAQAYGGYLWAKTSSYVSGLWDLLNFQTAEIPAVSAYYANVPALTLTSIPNLSAVRGCVHKASEVDTKFSRISADAKAALAGVAGASAVAWFFHDYGNGSYVWLETTNRFGGTGGIGVQVCFNLVTGTYYIGGGTQAQVDAAYAAIQSATLVAGTPAVPSTTLSVDAGTYTTNPDVLPIPAEADTVPLVNSVPDATAISYPAPGDLVPWVPPIWLPKVSGLDTSGAKSAIDDLLGQIANWGIPTDWSWVTSPLTGILGGFSALLGWFDAFVQWLEAQIANIFSPSLDAFQEEFQPRWEDFKAKLGDVWPFAVLQITDLVVGSFAGGNLYGAKQLSTTWHIVLYKSGQHEVAFDMKLADLTDPIEGYRWLLVAVVWIGLVGAVFWLFTPRVVT